MMIQGDSVSIFGIVAVLSLIPMATAAEVVPGDILNCKNVSVDADRLACYDKAIAKDRSVGAVAPVADAVVTPPADPAVPVTKWTVSQDASAMTDDTNHYISITSIGYVQCSQYGTSGPITLMARCMEDTTALFLYGDCHLASGFQGYGDVTWRTDDDKPRTRPFDASTDNAALGLWTGGNAIPAIKELFGKDRLVVRFTPFSMSPVEATFEIAGLDDVIKPLREECGW